MYIACLLYTSDAADDLLCVDLGGRRIIKKFLLNIYLFMRERERVGGAQTQAEGEAGSMQGA